MSTHILLSGILAGAAVRRKRRDTGALFAVATVRDADRGQPRVWRAFFNQSELIELVEEIRTGEPIAVTGPFSIVVAPRNIATSVECFSPRAATNVSIAALAAYSPAIHETVFNRTDFPLPPPPWMNRSACSRVDPVKQ